MFLIFLFSEAAEVSVNEESRRSRTRGPYSHGASDPYKYSTSGINKYSTYGPYSRSSGCGGRNCAARGFAAE